MSFADCFRRRGTALVVLLALAAPAAAAAQPRQVPGTRVTLQPPDGFIPAERFSGFQRAEDNASIVVVQLEAPFAQMEGRLTDEAFAEQGMRVRGSEQLSVDSLRARLVAVTQEARGEAFDKWALMFGDGEVTVIITATYPQRLAPSLDEAMRRAVLSARLGDRAPADPLAGLNFRIDEGPRLRIAQRLGNTLLLNESGRIPNPGPASPFLVVGVSVAPSDLGDLEAFSRRRITQTASFSRISNITGSAVTIDGSPAYELFADAVQTESSTPVRLYQVVVAEGSHYHLIQASAGVESAAEFIPEFQAIARTLRRTR
ncbi:hypothetical protein [Longimicrobium sp.]|uniref:hypothetical protein n=1 Tax=Longimicrobium sp. TaxID=2029185 RepID=UPI003B3A0D41